MSSIVLVLFVHFLVLVAAQSGSSSTTTSIGYGPFGNASMTPNGQPCGECNIFYFPNLRVWNDSNSDGGYDNFTVATAYVTIDETTNATTTSISAVNTSVPCNENSICVLFEPESPPVKTYTFSAGPSGINITQVVTSPTALIYWGAYSLQGAYPTTNAVGSTYCNSTTIASDFVIVPFTSVTAYPFSDIPAPYTGTVPVPSLSFEDLPFPTAQAENFLAQFSNQMAFSYCTPLRYYGSPMYASPVMQLTQTSVIRLAAVSTTPASTTSIVASTVVRPTLVSQTSTSVVVVPPTTQAASNPSTTVQSSAPPPIVSSLSTASSVSGPASLSPLPTTTTAPPAPASITIISTSSVPPGSVVGGSVIGGSVVGGSVVGGTVVGETVMGGTVVGGTVMGGTVVGGTVVGGTVVGGTVVSGIVVGGTTIPGTTVAGTTVAEITISGTTISGTTISGTTISEPSAGEPSPSTTTTGQSSPTFTVVPFQGGSSELANVYPAFLYTVCGIITMIPFI